MYLRLPPKALTIIAATSMCLVCSLARLAAAYELPGWARGNLGPEQVAHVDSCGFNCLEIYARTPPDSLNGWLLRVATHGDQIAWSSYGSWLRLDQEGNMGYVQILDKITLPEARAAIDAVRPLLEPGEYIRKVLVPDTWRLVDWKWVPAKKTGTIAVEFGRLGEDGGRTVVANLPGQ